MTAPSTQRNASTSCVCMLSTELILRTVHWCGAMFCDRAPDLMEQIAFHLSFYLSFHLSFHLSFIYLFGSGTSTITNHDPTLVCRRRCAVLGHAAARCGRRRRLPTLRHPQPQLLRRRLRRAGLRQHSTDVRGRHLPALRPGLPGCRLPWYPPPPPVLVMHVSTSLG